MKSIGEYKGAKFGKVSPELGRPVLRDRCGRDWAYYLEDLKERLLPHPWNVSNLKKYFYKLLSSLDVSNCPSYVYCSKFVYSYSTLHKCPISRSRNVRWRFCVGRRRYRITKGQKPSLCLTQVID